MWFDLIGAFFSLVSTWYFIRLDKKAWAVTLVASCINGFLYWKKGIYADMSLELFYFLSTCYGLILWKKPTGQTTIRRLIKKERLVVFAMAMLIFSVIAMLLTAFTHSKVVVLDALTTAFSLIAQWLMCHKRIATWFFWFATDLIYLVLYFQKQLPIHSALMLLYTGLAVAGYLSWAKREKLENEKTTPNWMFELDKGRTEWCQ
ncbi:MAG: nicotinamide riboside transporter PnuC [Tatlockia sp.]|jgi:nicotinamide mononucleotide transporter